MAKYTENQFNNWRKPPSDTEEQRLETTERRIREAIQKSEELKEYEIDVFGQGSYANDTNVKLESDVDINVCSTAYFYTDYGTEGLSDKTFGYTEGNHTYSNFKEKVRKALVAEFGDDNVKDKNKCFSVVENSNRVKADVVPTFELRRHDDATPSHVIKGVRYYAKDGTKVTNYPKQHIENGKWKNARTQKRFKRLVRIFKKIRYKMIEDRVQINSHITSFLLECLVWNVPEEVFNGYDTWTDRLKEAIRHIYNHTKTDDQCKEWGEVSEYLYLFRGSRKWSREDAHKFMLQMWQYLEF